MSDKVKLPKEEAEAIDKLRSDRFTDEQILRYAIKDEFAKQEYYCLSEMSSMTLAAALVNGYEVEQTPEEIIIQLYKKGLSITDKDVEGRLNGAFRLGIQNALTIVGIYIKGVNAE